MILKFGAKDNGEFGGSGVLFSEAEGMLDKGGFSCAPSARQEESEGRGLKLGAERLESIRRVGTVGRVGRVRAEMKRDRETGGG